MYVYIVTLLLSTLESRGAGIKLNDFLPWNVIAKTICYSICLLFRFCQLCIEFSSRHSLFLLDSWVKQPSRCFSQSDNKSDKASHGLSGRQPQPPFNRTPQTPEMKCFKWCEMKETPHSQPTCPTSAAKGAPLRWRNQHACLLLSLPASLTHSM